MAGIEESQFRVFDLDGERVNVPVRKAAEFTAANPSAQELRRYRAPVMDEDFWVRDGQTPPEGAERVYRFRSDDGVVNVPRGKLGGYIGSRATPDKDRSWGSYAGEAYADAGRAVGRAVGTVASNAADVARRIPAAAEGFLDRAAVAPVLLAGRVADALNPDPLAGPVDVLTGQRGRYSPQEMGYEEDPYRQGLASRTADRARAWLARRDEARAPTTPAGRVADVPVQFGTTLVGYSTPAGPLAMVGNAAAAGDRAYAEGASGAEALGRTAASLAAQAAAFGPRPIPVPGANAAGRAVEGASARIGGRLAQTPEGAARAVRTAVTAGQVARGAVESGARMAGVTAADGGDAKDVLIAAGVGGAVGGALRGLSTRPLARVAGDAAGRMARGGVDTTPPRMDPAGLAANRAEATARTPEGDAALARANAGLASPERAGLPAPAEPGAAPTVYGNRTIVPPYYGPTVSRPGEPITPPAPYADKVPEPIPETREEIVRRRKEALDALPLPQRLKKTGFSAYYDQHPDRAGVLDAIGFEKFAKLYRKFKGDFRNVTEDLVNASEVGGIVGRDYSGADGVRRALEDAAEEYAGYQEWKEQGAPTAEEEIQTGQEIAWNRAQNAEAEAEVRRRYELTHPEMTGEPRVTEEEIRAAQAAAEEGEVNRIEAEAMQEPDPAPAPAPAAGSATPPRVFALDGGTPAEIDAEKARVAEAQRRAALEEAAAAPGRDLGTVSIQEGLPGIGGDGTLFTPPAGGWSGRAASSPRGSALGDAATASPSLVEGGRENPAPAVTDTLGAPREGAAQKRAREDNEAATRARAALVKWDAGDGSEEEMRRCIAELEGRSLYASARDLRRAMGESVPRPGLSTAGAHEAWPAAEPGAVARVSMRDLVEAATALGNGRAPEVVKALRLLHGTALGAYRLGGGPITMRSDLWQLVDAEQRAALRSQAGEQAAEELPGAEPPELAARAAELYDQFLDEAIRQNAQDDAPVAAQVLAHEIGHWLDDLPDGLRGRGNILGRLASLKDYLASTLFKDPRDALGRDPFLTPKEREEIAKEATKGLRRKDFGSEEAFEKAKARARKRAIDAAILERGFATAPAVRAELDDLIAWYRQSDHAPEYFRKGEEMFAEAFSAYLNYPMTARAKAPTFCDLLEHWGSKKGEIWKAVEQLHRREPVFADTQGPWRQRFKERMRAHTGAWYALESYRPKDLPGSLREAWDRAAGYALAAFSGELRWVDRYSRILEKAREGRIRANGWGTPEGARAREAVHAYTHASTRAEEEMVRFRSEVLPVVEQGGATIEDFDVYLTLRRVANELLGADRTRGAMNLPNPSGLTPAAAAAELRNWEKEQPEVYAALVRAGELFNGIRRDTVLSLVERYGGLKKEGLDQILANDAYARFLKLFAPAGESRRRAAQGEMRATSGIRRRELGDLAQNVSPSLATLLGDAQIMFDVSLNGARREGVALLRAAAPSAVRPARMVWNQAHHRMEPEQVNTDGWRTVVWLEDGKPVGAEVRKWAADGLRGPHSRDPSVLDPAVDFLEWAGRQNSAAVTWLSWGFNLLNPFRDRSGMLRNTPAAQDAPLFVKAFGDVPAAVQSLFNGYGRMRETGEADPDLLAALRAGALPGANFAGRSNRAAVAGQLQALFEAGTDPEKYRAAADEVVRSLGLDPALVRTQKRLLGALSPLLEKAARAYTWLPRHLSRTETNAKVAGYRAVKLAHPDWPDARVAEYVSRNIGTPDPTAPSALAQIPGFRAFIPFYTMIYRGISDQLAGVARQQPGLMALRFAAHTAMRQMLTNPAWLLGSAIGATALGGGIVGWLRSLAKDEDVDEEDTAFYKRGLSAAADTLEWWAEAQRSVSPFDRARGYSIPLWTVDKDTKKYAYLLIPTAQELQPVDAVVDYAVDKLSRRNQYTFAALSDSVAGSTLPSAGVVPRSLLALSTGVDIGQGLQPVHRDELAGPWKHAWETAAAQWDIWTGRGWGMFPARAGAAAAWADEEKTAVERFLALPGVVNTLRPFLRVSNQGDAQTARMIDEWRERGLKQNSADAKEAAKAELRIDARFEAGKEDAAADAEDERISEEARERISETGASASELVRGARQRERDKRTLSPSERAIRRVPRRQRDEARELFGVPEPD